MRNLETAEKRSDRSLEDMEVDSNEEFEVNEDTFHVFIGRMVNEKLENMKLTEEEKQLGITKDIIEQICFGIVEQTLSSEGRFQRVPVLFLVVNKKGATLVNNVNDMDFLANSYVAPVPTLSNLFVAKLKQLIYMATDSKGNVVNFIYSKGLINDQELTEMEAVLKDRYDGDQLPFILHLPTENQIRKYFFTKATEEAVNAYPSRLVRDVRNIMLNYMRSVMEEEEIEENDQLHETSLELPTEEDVWNTLVSELEEEE